MTKWPLPYEKLRKDSMQKPQGGFQILKNVCQSVPQKFLKVVLKNA